MRRTALVQLVVAALALAGAVTSWLAAGSREQVPPIMDGQPTLSTVVYSPPLIVLALFLLTVAGVLAVLGIARWRRSRPPVGQATFAAGFDRPDRG
ncbi:hypothetical protein [Mycolicibacterium frederiksbergense]|uniref:hypothetical protein n=1 Tax=Mycolicibacterium frederiksbergense TaxID=117567 RepID=UPI00265C26B4|nr:hypothetical protein [Mycolicibacterium frederiksbergense]MDO0973015.1 hypothetical protein [Mycolicibacterium frederiksbergense]